MQKYTMYHPNAKCTGSAIKVIPVEAHDCGIEGHLFLSIARQTSTGNECEGTPTFPRFDWDNEVEVRLNPQEVMEIIRVIKGEQESINDGKGLYSRRGGCTLDVRHHIDPVPHYAVTIAKVDGKGEKSIRAFMLTPNEAATMDIALTYAIGPMVFGL